MYYIYSDNQGITGLITTTANAGLAKSILRALSTAGLAGHISMQPEDAPSPGGNGQICL